MIEWYYFKQLMIAKTLYPQYTETSEIYNLKLYEGPILLAECIIYKNLNIEDKDDFETNYKDLSNKPIVTSTTVQTIAPIGSKTIAVNGVIKKLFARFTGKQYEVTTGSNTLTYTATYPWSKIIGLEVINCEALDTCTLKVYDTAEGTYSGVPNLLLNQFSNELNLCKDYYIKMSQFDADVYAGFVIEITYVSKSAKTVGINFIINEVKD